MSHVLWTLTKTDERLEARTLPTAYGTELRIFLDGELVWSRTFLGEPEVATNAVLETAADKYQELLTQGWAPP